MCALPISEGKRGPRRRALSADFLATREMLTLTGVWANVTPQKLPNNGKYVPIVISGEVTNDNPKDRPVVRYQVIDQYRADEPKGNVTLTEQKPGHWVFKFTIHLQAQRNSNTRGARQYSVTLGYEDSDNGAGKTLPVIVPEYVAKPAPKPAARRSR